jgi:hypothetical protein
MHNNPVRRFMQPASCIFKLSWPWCYSALPSRTINASFEELNMQRLWWTSAVAMILLAPSAVVWADETSDVEALEAQCEQEREANIKPLRDMEIAKCKADTHNDPAYCERYWKDYGNAMRSSNGTMTPRKFDDLPDCVAAYKARKALINRKSS